MGGRRVRGFLAAGVVDSFAFALGWTVVLLDVVALHGVRGAAVCNGALFVGVALSAPLTDRLASLLDGRSLLRLTALVEAALRLAVLLGLVRGVPLGLVAVGVALMSATGWSGFAAMRAEAAVDGQSAVSLTWYAVGIGSIEAIGTAAGALLFGRTGHVLAGGAQIVVAVLFPLSLLPTFLVAGRARRTRALVRVATLEPLRTLARPLGGGLVVMLAGSGLALLAVPLAATLYGATAVAASAAAFGAGAVLAPLTARALSRTRGREALVWPLLGAGMAAGWVFATTSLVGLLVAQVLSGYAVTAFEGGMDALFAVAGSVTSRLAYASASRALGSAIAVAATPLLVTAPAIGSLAALEAALLLGAAGAVLLVPRGVRLVTRRPATA
jgi:hypothetical protein